MIVGEIKFTVVDSRLSGPPGAYRPPEPPPEKAGLWAKVRRARRELTSWAAEGAPLASREVRRARLAICRGCVYYHAAGNWGLGECQAPGCGCTRVKLALATSFCPLNPPKWRSCKPVSEPVQTSGSTNAQGLPSR